MNQYVAYYRVSTQKQGRSGLGLEAQKQYVLQFVRSVQGVLLSEHTDVVSGTKLQRAGLQKAMEQCAESGAALVVAKIDRLSREGFRIMAQLEDVGITYIDATSPQDTDFIKQLKFALAKEERQKISERTRAALQALKARGKTLGSPENLTPAAQVKAVESIKAQARLNRNNRQAHHLALLMRGNGASYSAIARQLNELGYQTRRGKAFTHKQVSRLLSADFFW